MKSLESWSLDQTGNWAVYAVGSDGEGASLVIRSMITGVERTIAVVGKEGPRGFQVRNFAPRWSPDGTRLAYLLPDKGIWHLHIWEIGREKDGVVAVQEACARINGCKQYMAWSPDSRSVYFLTKGLIPKVERSNGAEQDTDKRTPSSLADWRATLLPDPTHGGITVWASHAEPISNRPSTRWLPYAGTLVSVADVSTLTARTLLAGANVDELDLSPDGTKLLAQAASGIELQSRQSYADIYVFPLSSSCGFFHATSRNEAPKDTCGLKPVLRDVAAGPMAWAPNSRQFARVEKGAVAGGDVLMFDIATNKVTNLTANLVIHEANELSSTIGFISRNETTPNEKFGDSYSILWSPEGDALYLLRRAPFADGWKTRLWRLSLAGSAAVLTAGSKYDADFPLFDATTNASGELTIPISLPSGEAFIATLNPVTGKMRVVTSVAGNAIFNAPEEMGKESHDVVMFLSESSHVAEELYMFRRDRGDILPATQINTRLNGIATFPDVKKVSWTSPSGDRFGLVYKMPETSKSRSPLIIEIYPRQQEHPSIAATRFLGRKDVFLPPLGELLHEGYAIANIDLPIEGRGETCDGISRDLSAGLDALSRSGLVASGQVAIIGHSFGGWIVNCIIGRVHGLKAAVSVDGGSDLISDAFSASAVAAGWGIGGGQFGIGESVSQAPLLYWNESGVSTADKVDTPLLLVHGKADHSVPVEQSIEMYEALSRAGKEVKLVTLDSADHVGALSNASYVAEVTAWIEKFLGSPR